MHCAFCIKKSVVTQRKRHPVKMSFRFAATQLNSQLFIIGVVTRKRYTSTKEVYTYNKHII